MTDEPAAPAPPPVPRKPASVIEGIRRGFYKLVGLRLAKIPDDIRDTCDRYGEQVIGTILAGGFQPKTKELQEVCKTEESKKQNDKLSSMNW